MHRRWLVAAVACAVVLGAAQVPARAGKPAVPHWPVWLCFPGSAHDYVALVRSESAAYRAQHR